MEAQTLATEDEQFVQHLTLTGERPVAAAQQAFAASIRTEKVRPLLTPDTQRMVVKLGLQREAGPRGPRANPPTADGGVVFRHAAADGW
eukprot:6202285-Pleurochrysis_carterae.AAC.2